MLKKILLVLSIIAMIIVGFSATSINVLKADDEEAEEEFDFEAYEEEVFLLQEENQQEEERIQYLGSQIQFTEGISVEKKVYIPQTPIVKDDSAAQKAEQERLAAEAARKAEEERLAAEKAAAEEAARIAEQERIKAEEEKAKQQVNNGHGYTKQEVHDLASKYKQDISTVSTKAANVNGNILTEDIQKKIEDEIFNLVNETRAKVNSAPLTKTNLNSEMWADMMLETGLFEHAKLFNTYSYQNCTKIITKEVKAGVGDGWKQAGENIAWRAYAPDELAATYLNSQWNKSEGHYLNRINSAWIYYDVSVVKGEDGQWYAVERFAR